MISSGIFHLSNAFTKPTAYVVVQVFLATACGFLYGLETLRFGLWDAVLLHVLNNLLADAAFGDWAVASPTLVLASLSFYLALGLYKSTFFFVRRRAIEVGLMRLYFTRGRSKCARKSPFLRKTREEGRSYGCDTVGSYRLCPNY